MTLQSASRLRNALLRVLRHDASITGHDEQEVLEELAAHKQLLLRLLNVGDRNANERREIESGKTVVDGKSMAFNSDFARQVIFLSDQLDVSERYVAKLLHSITQRNPNMPALECVEAAVTQFHQRRQELLDCLTYILDAAIVSDVPGSPRVYKRVDTFARQHLFPAQATTAQKQSLALNVVQTVNVTAQLLAKAQAAKQNAVSQTSVPSQAAGASLGHDILEARCAALKQERRSLSNLLYLIARLGHLSSSELKTVVDWLAENPYHALTYYFLAATLAALDPVPADSEIGAARGALVKDKFFMDYMKKKLDPSSTWKEPTLKALILLKWSMFLTDARHRDASLELQDGFQTEELETQVWNGVQGDAFPYMSRLVLQLHRKGKLLPASLLARFAPLEQEQYRKPPPASFIPTVLEEFEILVLSLIRYASSELRKIKQRQEDIVLANARTDRGRLFRTTGADGEQDRVVVTPRNDIAAFYSCVGVLFSTLPPEHALQFWGANPVAVPASRRSSLAYLISAELTSPKLPSFLQWSVWSTQARDIDSTTALYDMFTGLAKGQQSSELAFNFIARGAGDVVQSGSVLGGVAGIGGPSISWGMLFGLLESWAVSATNQSTNQAPVATGPNLGMSSQWRPQAPQGPQHTQLVLTDKDVTFAEAFLRLLSAVVTHSVEVRKAIVAHTQFKAIPSLVNLVPLGLPLRLKGALFETLASFCEPGAGAAGVEICKAVWNLMERQEVINVRGALSSHSVPMKGVEMELEQIETPYKQYPATIPFLRLLVTLIHTPKRVLLHERVLEEQPTQTIPESLGQPYRLPGIGPFVSFVVDQVFAKIPERDYARSSDRWEMNDLCLCFIERCLASYELESLVTALENAQSPQQTVGPFLTHPGYDIMKRLLTSSPLQRSILSYIVDGVEGFDKGFAAEEPYFHSTVVRVLRIVQRILEVQDVFLDVLIPLLSELNFEAVAGQVLPRSSFTPFDRVLSFGSEYAPALAAYVTFPAYSELVLLSIEIVSYLTRSSSFADLTTVVERSADSERILGGYRRVLEVETHEDIAFAETRAEQATGAGAVDVDDALDLSQAARLAAIDMLVHHTTSDRPYPNMAHFLLFGQSRATKIEDPHALGAQAACVHVLVKLLNTAVPSLTSQGRHADLDAESSPLFMTLPALAERCCRVIHQLCYHPRTSDFVTRYLRTQEDFFARQLAAIPYQVPSFSDESPIELLYADGSRVRTSVTVTSSFLRYRSLILNLVALDLHILTIKGHYQGIAELTELLLESQDGEDFEQNGVDLAAFREIGQSHLRVVELAQSLNFDWSDSLTATAANLEFLGQLNLAACVRMDDSGCEVVDRSAVLALISSARRSLYTQGRLVNQAQVDQLKAEVTYILESCAVENHRREIQFAVSVGFESWRRLLDMTLTKCFTRLPHDQRENMLFDLLHVIPHIICSNNILEPTAVLLAEAQLSAITKLRENRIYQLITQGNSELGVASSLPAERLYALLRDIIQCVLDKLRGELVRGNLYAALVNYMQLASANDISFQSVKRKSDALSLTAYTQDDLLSSLSGPQADTQARGHDAPSSLQQGILTVLEGVMGHLITMASRDALDGSEIWRTVAFMLLDSLVHLGNGKRSNQALAALARHGVLVNFVRAIEQDDGRLQDILKPDPDDLHSLYVYEAKMSLLVRISLTRPGAERLLEARILYSLTKCEYLDSRPDTDQSFADQDSFLPSAIQRYHQLFTPALQIVNGILAMLGDEHTSARKQALEFLSSHRDTVIILLKSEADLGSLAAIEEMRLVVDICAHVLPLVPRSEMTSSISGYGGVHAAILNLAARMIGTDEGAQAIYPHSESEYRDSQNFSKGSAHSQFEMKALEKTQALRNALVVYLGSVSEFTEPELTLVLSPMVTKSRRDDASSRTLAHVPTIGDALDALDNLSSRLTVLFGQVTALSAELASEDRLRVDNIHELVTVPDTDFLEDLDVRQKQALVGAQLGRIRATTKAEAGRLTNTLEMLLLLVWRHLHHYSETHGRLDVQPKTSFAQSTRILATHDASSFRTETTRRLYPLLQRLGAIDINPDELGDEWRSNVAYLDVMCRRLADIVGLTDATSSDQSP